MSAALALKGSRAVVFGTPERVEFHLENWRRWMRSGQEVDALPHSSEGLSCGGTSKGFDEMVEAEDRRCAKIVNVILDNLPPVQRIAIYIERRIMGRVFQFQRTPYAEALKEGKLAVGRELNRRGVW